MGYSTSFEGSFLIVPPLNPAQVEEVNKFSRERHDPRNLHFEEDKWNRHGELVEQLPGLGFVVQPIWCQWRVLSPGERVDSWDGGIFEPDLSGQSLVWDGSEKFYDYVPWLKFLIKRFFGPWGVQLSGEVEWRGEDEDDLGKIKVLPGNVVEVYDGRISVEYVKRPTNDGAGGFDA